MSTFSEIKSAREEISLIPGITNKPRGAVSHFFSRISRAFDLIWEEKEIMTFAILQWLLVGLTLYLCVSVMSAYPVETWITEVNGEEQPTFMAIMWVVTCIGLGAWPVGILSGCMGAAHFLHRQGRESTIGLCLNQVMPQAWKLWVFHWVDGVVTAYYYFHGNGKNRTSFVGNAIKKVLYFTWKLTVAGMLPSLLQGRTMKSSARSSVEFLKANAVEIALIRFGYGTISTVLMVVIGILSAMFVGFFLAGSGLHMSVLISMVVMAMLGSVMLVMRPLYILVICDLYSDFIEAQSLQRREEARAQAESEKRLNGYQK